MCFLTENVGRELFFHSFSALGPLKAPIEKVASKREPKGGQNHFDLVTVRSMFESFGGLKIDGISSVF